MLLGVPIAFSWVPGMPVVPHSAIQNVTAPPAPYSAIYSAGAPPVPCRDTGAPHNAALQPVTGMQWSNQPTPYASPFMAPPVWPMYMPGDIPRPLTQPPFLQAQFEEFARRNQDMEAQELEIQHMSKL